MEFITTYQMPLIFGGLLIIMALIGYEADKHQKEKNGEQQPKKKKVKKGKSEQTEGQPITVDNTAMVTPVDNAIKEQVTVTESKPKEETVTVVESQPQVSAQAVESQSVQSQVQNVSEVPVANNDALSAFKEPNNVVSNNDTFGVNDMSSFKIQPNEKKDAQVNSADAWKL